MTRNVTWDRGVSLPDHAIWFDPEVARALAVVTHAHTDHSRRHRETYLTAETLALTAAARRPKAARVIGYEVDQQVAGGTLRLVPAGHMLGSAQVLFRAPAGSLLYTGDVKLRGPRPVRMPKADVLVIESTYGRPNFVFPDHGEVIEAIATWCSRVLAEGVTPVLLCHAVGKAQEVMLALAPYGIRFALEARCLPGTEAYLELGEAMPDYIELVPGEDYSGRVVIAPPAGKAVIRRLHRYRCALVSGWAQDRHFRAIFGADVAFPLSDHCDFHELVETVEMVAPEQVYTVHGFTDDLARHLRKRGVRAFALRGVEQLALAFV
ncbi:MAG TPA: MBL fold metallo-hydrolase RNA specificity domain-containing protein [Candidatus Dormibacteraeota bacterium]|nr:MBL fold metallo-hydrolase RNA specificity domain-containing protein [Candidatus Dormibacteraeota bacterium]